MATKIGIRQLVEFVLRQGDLNEVKNSQNTALNGAKIHRQLQSSRGEDYDSEVYLKKIVTMNDTDYIIAGRADGIQLNDDGALIEEIKTSDQVFEDLSTNTLTLYWGQIKVYGYLLLQEHPDLEQVTLQLTYFQVINEKITKTQQILHRAELDAFFHDLITEYEYWLTLRADLRRQRNASIEDLPFPFPAFRPGQHELAGAVYKTIRLQKRLFVEAPTGTGKTISTLFPAIKAMGEDVIERLFYLTAKQSTRHVAEEAVTLMSHDGLKLKSITLTAKDQIRFPEEQDVLPEDNPYMIGYYDRLKPALKDLLTHEDQITRSVIEQYARKHTVDPFEFSLDTSLFCDVIICDYNYLFDPLVYLQRLFSERDDDNFFLIDEVHNLVSRSRDMYSAAVSDQPISALLKLAKPDKSQPSDDLQRELKKVRRSFTRISKTLIDDQVTEQVLPDPPDKLLRTLRTFNEFVTDWLAQQKPGPLLDAVRDYFFACLTFVKIGDLYDGSYQTRFVLDGHHLTIKELCLDPSDFLNRSLELGSGAVLFSATLTPMAYYQRVLGGEANSLAYQLPSPFPPKHQAILVTQYVQTTYHEREHNVPRIIASLHAMLTAKHGNYLVFFPSYGYLLQIKTAFEAAYPDVATTAQASTMDATARQTFLNQFQSAPSQTLLGFCVLGGIFSEGIDLRGDRLIGVAIVSVGLPGINPETNLIRDYYDHQNGLGFAYAYQLPGMNNVLQAAGRLIRSAKDTGIVLLLDQRFASRRYTDLFPAHWQYYQTIQSVPQLEATIANFWHQMEVTH
ncbi:ATP-dependent DNA helicase [Lactiplantibacillus plantarum]|uniref:ATP-dependent DNA helicase n=1 Tax=Lactiplantibacillus plantarum TaxID=1590 RepID=UPI000FF8F924|nr:ATP-dependent DNA helicase [Lactiplantibacillus plantarum]MBX0342838.1 ATP-dependent DNA helicase [Lactiplantibacillus plantarum]MCC6113363.1 ATP-dependent DNA helicase [Lactiplantibacillus plantarum]MCG0697434.1 putative DNA helicase (putative) [Lactiplantibacillus plantarum]MCG0700392.1 putative DNA helicase (putative) [Lactiplantibacillus plantarum]MCG0703381.1 putative DNA helicase (putative) [Lactiplantibacillus plantarum]